MIGLPCCHQSVHWWSPGWYPSSRLNFGYEYRNDQLLVAFAWSGADAVADGVPAFFRLAAISLFQ
jgi:hypothetical protein